MAILVAKKFNFKEDAQLVEPQGWFICLKETLNGANMTVVSIHASNWAQFLDETV